MSFDTEDLLRSLKTILVDNLNTEITCINTIKNDTMLSTINDDAYYLQNLDDEAFSYQNFIVYGMFDSPKSTDAIETASIRKLDIFVEVVIAKDSGPRKENSFYKILRYTRALENLIVKKSDYIQSGIKWKVSSLSPTSFAIRDENDEIVKEFMTGGIQIVAAISTPL